MRAPVSPQLRDQARGCWETHLLGCYIMKDVIKDRDGQPDEEVHRESSGRVPSPGASVPLQLGCVSLLAHGCVHKHGGSQNPILQGFYGGFLIWHDQLLTPFLAPLPSPENGGWG